MRTAGAASLVLSLMVAGCLESHPPRGGDDLAAMESGSSEGAVSGTAAQTAGESSGPEQTGVPGEGEPGVIRFAAFGDTGEGNEAQQMVANAAELVCADRGCDFGWLMGDNFYDEGVTSSMDQQFVDKFEVVYEGLDIPFYVVLGNHDYGLLANDWARGDYQLEYARFNDKWVLPHFWYTFSSESGATQFFAFDTARMMWSHDVEIQREWLSQELGASAAQWKIAIAHHPYISNGKHGNAGNFDGFPQLPFLAGEDVRGTIADHVCGKAQIYISAHDHNRQAFDPVCGTYFFVSGASAKTEDFVHRDENPTQWEDDTREGFLWVQIQGTETTLAFYDLDGNLDHETTVSL